jgi:hypothetical protein
MAKLLKLLFWIAVIYGAVVYGWPWLQGTIEGIGEGTASTAKGLSAGPGGRCYKLASDAADDFGNGMRGFSSPPYDTEAWAEFEQEIGDRIAYADAECRCAEDTCSLSREALRELDRMVEDFGRMIRTGTSSRIDPGRDMERVYGLLASARAAMP